MLRNIASGIRSLFRKLLVERELDEELRSYMEMAVQEEMRRGVTRDQALRAVRLERGNLEVAKEIVRTAGWESFVETFCQDVRFALRTLRKSPSFTTVAAHIGFGHRCEHCDLHLDLRGDVEDSSSIKSRPALSTGRQRQLLCHDRHAKPWQFRSLFLSPLRKPARPHA